MTSTDQDHLTTFAIHKRLRTAGFAMRYTDEVKRTRCSYRVAPLLHVFASSVARDQTRLVRDGHSSSTRFTLDGNSFASRCAVEISLVTAP